METTKNVTLSHFSLQKEIDLASENGIDSRQRFLHAYAETFGNVSASCVYAGISRETYYRWMKSITRVNRKFQRQIAALKPKERQIDIAESALMDKIAQGHWRAIEFVLKTRGRTRGWVTREADDESPTSSDADKVAEGVRLWLDWYPGANLAEIQRWIGMFSNSSGVEVADIVSSLGLEEILDRKERRERRINALETPLSDPKS